MEPMAIGAVRAMTPVTWPDMAVPISVAQKMPVVKAIAAAIGAAVQFSAMGASVAPFDPIEMHRLRGPESPEDRIPAAGE